MLSNPGEGGEVVAHVMFCPQSPGISPVSRVFLREEVIVRRTRASVNSTCGGSISRAAES